jgi:hypothetical protein
MQPTNAGGAARRPQQLSDGELRNVGSLRSFAADWHFVGRTHKHMGLADVNIAMVMNSLEAGRLWTAAS